MQEGLEMHQWLPCINLFLLVASVYFGDIKFFEQLSQHTLLNALRLDDSMFRPVNIVLTNNEKTIFCIPILIVQTEPYSMDLLIGSNYYESNRSIEFLIYELLHKIACLNGSTLHVDNHLILVLSLDCVVFHNKQVTNIVFHVGFVMFLQCWVSNSIVQQYLPVIDLLIDHHCLS